MLAYFNDLLQVVDKFNHAISESFVHKTLDGLVLNVNEFEIVSKFSFSPIVQLLRQLLCVLASQKLFTELFLKPLIYLVFLAVAAEYNFFEALELRVMSQHTLVKHEPWNEL